MKKLIFDEMFIIENLPYLSCFFNMLHYVYVFAFHNFYYTSNVKSQISVIHRMVTGCKPFKPPNFCLDLSLATWRSDFFFTSLAVAIATMTTSGKVHGNAASFDDFVNRGEHTLDILHNAIGSRRVFPRSAYGLPFVELVR